MRVLRESGGAPGHPHRLRGTRASMLHGVGGGFLARTLFNEWANYVINPIAVMAAHYKDPSGHKRHDVLYSYIYRSY